jgi:hypothetical protein
LHQGFSCLRLLLLLLLLDTNHNQVRRLLLDTNRNQVRPHQQHPPAMLSSCRHIRCIFIHLLPNHCSSSSSSK